MKENFTYTIQFDMFMMNGGLYESNFVFKSSDMTSIFINKKLNDDKDKKKLAYKIRTRAGLGMKVLRYYNKVILTNSILTAKKFFVHFLQIVRFIFPSLRPKHDCYVKFDHILFYIINNQCNATL